MCNDVYRAERYSVLENKWTDLPLMAGGRRSYCTACWLPEPIARIAIVGRSSMDGDRSVLLFDPVTLKYSNWEQSQDDIRRELMTPRQRSPTDVYLPELNYPRMESHIIPWNTMGGAGAGGGSVFVIGSATDRSSPGGEFMTLSPPAVSASSGFGVSVGDDAATIAAKQATAKAIAEALAPPSVAVGSGGSGGSGGFDSLVWRPFRVPAEFGKKKLLAATATRDRLWCFSQMSVQWFIPAYEQLVPPTLKRRPSGGPAYEDDDSIQVMQPVFTGEGTWHVAPEIPQFASRILSVVAITDQ